MKTLTLDKLADYLTDKQTPTFEQWARHLESVRAMFKKEGRTLSNNASQAEYQKDREYTRGRVLQALVAASQAGELRLLDGGTGLPADAERLKRIRTFYDFVTFATADEYLKRTGSPHRVKDADDPSAQGWKAEARKMADEINRRDRAAGLRPSQMDIAKEIARKFREKGIRSTKNKDLSADNIARHALEGSK